MCHLFPALTAHLFREVAGVFFFRLSAATHRSNASPTSSSPASSTPPIALTPFTDTSLELPRSASATPKSPVNELPIPPASCTATVDLHRVPRAQRRQNPRRCGPRTRHRPPLMSSLPASPASTPFSSRAGVRTRCPPAPRQAGLPLRLTLASSQHQPKRQTRLTRHPSPFLRHPGDRRRVPARWEGRRKRAKPAAG